MELLLKQDGGNMDHITHELNFTATIPIEEFRKAIGELHQEVQKTKQVFDVVLTVKRIKIKGKQYARPFVYEGNLFYTGFKIED